MGLNTLFGEITSEQSKKLPSHLRNPARLQRYVDAFALRLQGVSFRGVQEHFGYKSLSSAQNAVRNGEKICKELNIDQEIIRLKLTNYFNELADVVIGQVREQVEEGRVMQIAHSDGSKEVRRTKGVDPRLLGEAGRGLIRFAEFAGLMDRAPEVNQAVVSMVNLSSPSDGATFAQKWTQTVDVTPSGQESGQTQPAIEAAADDVTASKAVDPENKG